MIERALMVGSAVGVMCPNMLGCEALDEGGAFFQLLLVKIGWSWGQERWLMKELYVRPGSKVPLG